jgi:hypothetical protein
VERLLLAGRDELPGRQTVSSRDRQMAWHKSLERAESVPGRLPPQARATGARRAHPQTLKRCPLSPGQAGAATLGPWETQAVQEVQMAVFPTSSW